MKLIDLWLSGWRFKVLFVILVIVGFVLGSVFSERPVKRAGVAAEFSLSV